MSASILAIHSSSCPGAQQVLDAARELFAEQGIDAVSIQDIATKAGVSKANVFHHFASKEALYIEVIRACTQYKNATIASLIDDPAPFEQRFLKLLQAQLRGMSEDPSGTRLVIREVTNGNIERAKRIATEIFSAQIRERLAFFEDARQRGELNKGIEPFVCDMLIGACCMFHFNCGELSKHISSELGMPMPLSIEEFSRVMSHALIHGMGVTTQKPAHAAKPKRAGKAAAPPAPARPRSSSRRTRSP